MSERIRTAELEEKRAILIENLRDPQDLWPEYRQGREALRQFLKKMPPLNILTDLLASFIAEKVAKPNAANPEEIRAAIATENSFSPQEVKILVEIGRIENPKEWDEYLKAYVAKKLQEPFPNLLPSDLLPPNLFQRHQSNSSSDKEFPRVLLGFLYHYGTELFQPFQKHFLGKSKTLPPAILPGDILALMVVISTNYYAQQENCSNSLRCGAQKVIDSLAKDTYGDSFHRWQPLPGLQSDEIWKSMKSATQLRLAFFAAAEELNSQIKS